MSSERLTAINKQLRAVSTAITEVMENGQSFAVSGLTATSANLSDLRQLEKELRREKSRLTGSRPFYSAARFG